MIPASFAAFYAFLGLVAPGLMFQLLRERRRPVLEQTAFREASYVALSSFAFTSLSTGLLALLARRHPGWLVDPSKWFSAPKSYAAANVTLVARSAILEVLLACLLAAVTHATIATRASDGRMITTSLWYHKFKTQVPSGKATWVQVQLNDGTRFWGYVEHFTTEKALGDRELSLRGPGLAVKSADKTRSTTTTFGSITLRGDQIQSMRVAYRDAEAPAPRSRWWKKDQAHDVHS